MVTTMYNNTNNYAITYTNFKLTYRENYGKPMKNFFGGEGGW